MNRKRMLIIIFSLILLNVSAQVHETSNSKWPARTNGFSIYATTLMGAFTPINISYDYLLHKSRIHIGYTTGLTTTLYEGAAYGTLGVHLTMTIMTGIGKNHFETKLGGVVNPIKLWSDGYDDYAFKFVPVISLGYRFQKPENKIFYRVGLSTGGIGLGIGFIM